MGFFRVIVGFFRDDSPLSSMRLICFIFAIAAVAFAYLDKDIAVIGLFLGAAVGGKNWAKALEK